MGLCASSDKFCWWSGEVIRGLQGVRKLADDILVQDPTIDILIEWTRALMQKCQDHGHILSRIVVFPSQPNQKASLNFQGPWTFMSSTVSLECATNWFSFTHFSVLFWLPCKEECIIHMPEKTRATFWSYRAAVDISHGPASFQFVASNRLDHGCIQIKPQFCIASFRPLRPLQRGSM